MYSRLLPDTKTLDLFIENEFIFVNGITAFGPDRLLAKNDLIQLLISLKFYIADR